jgi:hypothetical protein
MKILMIIGGIVSITLILTETLFKTTLIKIRDWSIDTLNKINKR